MPYPIRAHVEGCRNSLSVPVDLCACGGRDFMPEQPPDPPGAPSSEPPASLSLDDIRAVANFIHGWHPGYEDAIAWGSSGPDGNTKANAIYLAAERILKALQGSPGADPSRTLALTEALEDERGISAGLMVRITELEARASNSLALQAPFEKRVRDIAQLLREAAAALDPARERREP